MPQPGIGSVTANCGCQRRFAVRLRIPSLKAVLHGRSIGPWAYGHAERNLALLRQLEAETRQRLESLDQPDPEQSACLQQEDAAVLVPGYASDQALPPDAERQFAARMGATTVEIPSSHVAMVSHPGEVARLIETAAEAVLATS